MNVSNAVQYFCLFVCYAIYKSSKTLGHHNVFSKKKICSLFSVINPITAGKIVAIFHIR